MRKKQVIKLNEGAIKKIVTECVKRLMEHEDFFRKSYFPSRFEENPYLEDPNIGYYYDCPLAMDPDTAKKWEEEESWRNFDERKKAIDKLYQDEGPENFLHRTYGNKSIKEAKINKIIKECIKKVLNENINRHPKISGGNQQYAKPNQIQADRANFQKYYEELNTKGEVFVKYADEDFDAWLRQKHPELNYHVRLCADWYERTKFYKVGTDPTVGPAQDPRDKNRLKQTRGLKFPDNQQIMKEQQENSQYQNGNYRYWSGQYYLWGDNMNEKVNVSGYIDKNRENASKCQVFDVKITIGNKTPINFENCIVDFTTLFNGKGFFEIRDVNSDRVIRLMKSPMH